MAKLLAHLLATAALWVRIQTSSVADPRMFVYPGSRILIFTHPGSRISDPGSKNSNKRQRWKKICYHIFFCSHKFHKIEYYVIFEKLKKKIWANFQRIVEVFTPKIFNILSNIWVWDPGSGKNLFRIPDPGVKKAPDPGSGSATLQTSLNNTKWAT